MQKFQNQRFSHDEVKRLMANTFYSMMPKEREIPDIQFSDLKNSSLALEDGVEFGIAKQSQMERVVYQRAILEIDSIIENFFNSSLLKLNIVYRITGKEITAGSIMRDRDGRWSISDRKISLSDSREDGLNKIEIYAVHPSTTTINMGDFYLLRMRTMEGFELLRSVDEFDAETANNHWIISKDSYLVEATTDSEFDGPQLPTDFLKELVKSQNTTEPIGHIFVSGSKDDNVDPDDNCLVVFYY